MTTATNLSDKPADPDEAFGRAVHMAMYDQRVTGRQLSQRTGIEQSLLSKKLRGKRPWSLGDTIAVADSLHVDLRDLLTSMWGDKGTPISDVNKEPSILCYSDSNVIMGPWGHELLSEAS